MGEESAGEGVPELPSEGGALLLRRHHVGVRHVGPPRFGLPVEEER